MIDKLILNQVTSESLSISNQLKCINTVKAKKERKKNKTKPRINDYRFEAIFVTSAYILPIQIVSLSLFQNPQNWLELGQNFLQRTDIIHLSLISLNDKLKWP
jgi:hypothetical protein